MDLYSKLNYNDLRQQSMRRGLGGKGHKEEIIQRLRDEDLRLTSQKGPTKITKQTIVSNKPIATKELDFINPNVRLDILKSSGLNILSLNTLAEEPTTSNTQTLINIPFIAKEEQYDYRSICVLLASVTPDGLHMLGGKSSYIRNMILQPAFWWARINSEYPLQYRNISTIGWIQYAHLIYLQRWLIIKSDLSEFLPVVFPSADDAHKVSSKININNQIVSVKLIHSNQGLVDKINFISLRDGLIVSTTRAPLVDISLFKDQKTMDISKTSLIISDEPNKGWKLASEAIDKMAWIKLV